MVRNADGDGGKLDRPRGNRTTTCEHFATPPTMAKRPASRVGSHQTHPTSRVGLRQTHPTSWVRPRQTHPTSRVEPHRTHPTSWVRPRQTHPTSRVGSHQTHPTSWVRPHQTGPASGPCLGRSVGAADHVRRFPPGPRSGTPAPPSPLGPIFRPEARAAGPIPPIDRRDGSTPAPPAPRRSVDGP